MVINVQSLYRNNKKHGVHTRNNDKYQIYVYTEMNGDCELGTNSISTIIVLYGVYYTHIAYNRNQNAFGIPDGKKVAEQSTMPPN